MNDTPRRTPIATSKPPYVLRHELDGAVNQPKAISIAAQDLRFDGRMSEAEDMLRDGLEKYPDSGLLKNGLAKVLRIDRTKDDETLQLLADAYHQSPDNKYFAMDYAKFLTQKRHFQKAELVYGGLYRQEGDNVMLLTAVGNLYQRWGQSVKAIACFGKACTLPEADITCARRYRELTGLDGKHFDGSGWQHVKVRLLSFGAPGQPDAGNAPKPRQDGS